MFFDKVCKIVRIKIAIYYFPHNRPEQRLKNSLLNAKLIKLLLRDNDYSKDPLKRKWFIFFTDKELK